MSQTWENAQSRGIQAIGVKQAPFYPTLQRGHPLIYGANQTAWTNTLVRSADSNLRLIDGSWQANG